MTEEGMQGHCRPMAGKGSYQRIEGSIYPQPRQSKRMLLSFYEQSDACTSLSCTALSGSASYARGCKRSA